MQNPILDALISSRFDENDPLNYLRTKIESDRDLYEVRKSTLSELEQAKEEMRLAQLENFLSLLVAERIHNSCSARANGHMIATEIDTTKEFLSWDKQPTINALTFLLNDFFSNSYPGKQWNDAFISEVVFEVTRIINFLNTNCVNKQQPPTP